LKQAEMPNFNVLKVWTKALESLIKIQWYYSVCVKDQSEHVNYVQIILFLWCPAQAAVSTALVQYLAESWMVRDGWNGGSLPYIFS